MGNIEKLPKKILRIEDLTFILPDDFAGGLSEAVDTLSDYIQTSNIKQLNDDESTVLSLLSRIQQGDCARLCIKYGVFEKVDNANYRLVE